MKCCLCKKKIVVDEYGWAKGHNAHPLKKGRCCWDCNLRKVIPERIKNFEEQNKIK